MTRYGWLTLSLGLMFASVGAVRAGDQEKKIPALGEGPAYEALGKLPVMHAGREKPLDTLAREEVKQIFGRETIKLHDEKNKVFQTWAPVAALFDWSSRPEFWDDQAFILVEYVPLKRLLLEESIQGRLSTIADKESTTPADRTGLKSLVEDKELSAAKIEAFLAGSKLAQDDRLAISVLAATLAEEHKWLTPRQLEEAKVAVEGEGKVPFEHWMGDLVKKKRQADASATGDIKLTEVEKRAIEVGTRLVHYSAIRDRKISSVEPFLVLPRPNNPTYLAYMSKSFEKAREAGSANVLTPLELDSANALYVYWNDIPIDDRALPGKDAKFDAAFTAWLRDKSVWIPLRAILDTKPEELTEAGFPSDKINAFLTAFRELDRAEAEAPGVVAEAKTAGLVSSARALGESLNDSHYPTVASIERETYFNETNPFWKAPVAYGFATALLAVSLGFIGSGRKSFLGKFGQATYAVGMLGLVGGIIYEIIGFYYRVRISGWAPVTNMYETVIWVSLVAAVLGLIFEGIFRKTFSALAGSGVALLGTVLAANVPLLDPNIHALQPVLRSNYWLTIHVLTEVSSYAAFLLAAGLGLIATFYYLTATYRRSPSYGELARPLMPALPMFAVGTVGLLATQGKLGVPWPTGDGVFYLTALLAGLGGMLTIVGVGSVLGEMVSRWSFREDAAIDDAAIAGETREEAYAAQAQVGQAKVAAASGSGSVATLANPTVAEIRAMGAAARPKLDARGLAMQATAAQIKPLSNFIYRTMQVGVLLVAAGTILGGVWADYSWGRFWGWDPKEVWALITLLVYLIPLHGRFAGWINTFALVVASVVCSMSVIMAWYGVNFVLGVGLHSYGFTEGGGQGVVLSVVAAVLALPAAAAWRRALASRPAVA